MTHSSALPAVALGDDLSTDEGRAPHQATTRTQDPPWTGTGTAEPLPVPPTNRERDTEWVDAALDVVELTGVPMAELRIMANRMYRLMDTDRPPRWAGERYEAVVEEIESRSERTRRSGAAPSRQVFKDSAYNSRFEVYRDGLLAAYIRYSLHKGEMTLLTLVEKSEFEGSGLWQNLIRQAMLNAHKRRLNVIPGCPAAHAFLQQYPQYLALTRSVR
jgi:predicted GNAT family acetyltransferase